MEKATYSGFSEDDELEGTMRELVRHPSLLPGWSPEPGVTKAMARKVRACDIRAMRQQLGTPAARPQSLLHCYDKLLQRAISIVLDREPGLTPLSLTAPRVLAAAPRWVADIEPHVHAIPKNIQQARARYIITGGIVAKQKGEKEEKSVNKEEKSVNIEEKSVNIEDMRRKPVKGGKAVEWIVGTTLRTMSAALRGGADLSTALTHAAAAAGCSDTHVHTLWEQVVKVSMVKVRCVCRGGDVITPLHLHISAFNWFAADLYLLYCNIENLIDQESLEHKEQRTSLNQLFSLVQQFKVAEKPSRDGWRNVLRCYKMRSRSSTIVVLQRRWYELVTLTRRQFLEAARSNLPGYTIPLLLRDIALKVPSVVSRSHRAWADQVREGRIYTTDLDEYLKEEAERKKNEPVLKGNRVYMPQTDRYEIPDGENTDSDEDVGKVNTDEENDHEELVADVDDGKYVEDSSSDAAGNSKDDKNISNTDKAVSESKSINTITEPSLRSLETRIDAILDDIHGESSSKEISLDNVGFNKDFKTRLQKVAKVTSTIVLDESSEEDNKPMNINKKDVNLSTKELNSNNEIERISEMEVNSSISDPSNLLLQLDPTVVEARVIFSDDDDDNSNCTSTADFNNEDINIDKTPKEEIRFPNIQFEPDPWLDESKFLNTKIQFELHSNIDVKNETAYDNAKECGSELSLDLPEDNDRTVKTVAKIEENEPTNKTDGNTGSNICLSKTDSSRTKIIGLKIPKLNAAKEAQNIAPSGPRKTSTAKGVSGNKRDLYKTVSRNPGPFSKTRFRRRNCAFLENHSQETAGQRPLKNTNIQSRDHDIDDTDVSRRLFPKAIKDTSDKSNDDNNDPKDKLLQMPIVVLEKIDESRLWTKYAEGSAIDLSKCEITHKDRNYYRIYHKNTDSKCSISQNDHDYEMEVNINNMRAKSEAKYNFVIFFNGVNKTKKYLHRTRNIRGEYNMKWYFENDLATIPGFSSSRKGLSKDFLRRNRDLLQVCTRTTVDLEDVSKDIARASISRLKRKSEVLTCGRDTDDGAIETTRRKKVSLVDIEEVRRQNSSLLTAQVRPIYHTRGGLERDGDNVDGCYANAAEQINIGQVEVSDVAGPSNVPSEYVPNSVNVDSETVLDVPVSESEFDLDLDLDALPESVPVAETGPEPKPVDKSESNYETQTESKEKSESSLTLEDIDRVLKNTENLCQPLEQQSPLPLEAGSNVGHKKRWCWSARRHVVLNQARLKLRLEAGRQPPSDNNIHSRSRRCEAGRCACCGASQLSSSGIQHTAQKPVAGLSKNKARGPYRKTKRKKMESQQEIDENPAGDLEEWKRQKTALEKYFQLRGNNLHTQTEPGSSKVTKKKTLTENATVVVDTNTAIRNAETRENDFHSIPYNTARIEGDGVIRDIHAKSNVGNLNWNVFVDHARNTKNYDRIPVNNSGDTNHDVINDGNSISAVSFGSNLISHVILPGNSVNDDVLGVSSINEFKLPENWGNDDEMAHSSSDATMAENAVSNETITKPATVSGNSSQMLVQVPTVTSDTFEKELVKISIALDLDRDLGIVPVTIKEEPETNTKSNSEEITTEVETGYGEEFIKIKVGQEHWDEIKVKVQPVECGEIAFDEVVDCGEIKIEEKNNFDKIDIEEEAIVCEEIKIRKQIKLTETEIDKDAVDYDEVNIEEKEVGCSEKQSKPDLIEESLNVQKEPCNLQNNISTATAQEILKKVKYIPYSGQQASNLFENKAVLGNVVSLGDGTQLLVSPLVSNEVPSWIMKPDATQEYDSEGIEEQVNDGTIVGKIVDCGKTEIEEHNNFSNIKVEAKAVDFHEIKKETVDCVEREAKEQVDCCEIMIEEQPVHGAETGIEEQVSDNSGIKIEEEPVRYGEIDVEEEKVDCGVVQHKTDSAEQSQNEPNENHGNSTAMMQNTSNSIPYVILGNAVSLGNGSQLLISPLVSSQVPQWLVKPDETNISEKSLAPNSILIDIQQTMSVPNVKDVHETASMTGTVTVKDPGNMNSVETSHSTNTNTGARLILTIDPNVVNNPTTKAQNVMNDPGNVLNIGKTNIEKQYVDSGEMSTKEQIDCGVIKTEKLVEGYCEINIEEQSASDEATGCSEAEIERPIDYGEINNDEQAVVCIEVKTENQGDCCKIMNEEQPIDNENTRIEEQMLDNSEIKIEDEAVGYGALVDIDEEEVYCSETQIEADLVEESSTQKVPRESVNVQHANSTVQNTLHKHFAQSSTQALNASENNVILGNVVSLGDGTQLLISPLVSNEVPSWIAKPEYKNLPNSVPTKLQVPNSPKVKTSRKTPHTTFTYTSITKNKNPDETKSMAPPHNPNTHTGCNLVITINSNASDPTITAQNVGNVLNVGGNVITNSARTNIGDASTNLTSVDSKIAEVETLVSPDLIVRNNELKRNVNDYSKQFGSRILPKPLPVANALINKLVDVDFWKRRRRSKLVRKPFRVKGLHTKNEEKVAAKTLQEQLVAEYSQPQPATKNVPNEQEVTYVPKILKKAQSLKKQLKLPEVQIESVVSVTKERDQSYAFVRNQIKPSAVTLDPQKLSATSDPDQQKSAALTASNEESSSSLTQQKPTNVNAPNQQKRVISIHKLFSICDQNQQKSVVLSAPNQQRLTDTSALTQQEQSVMCVPNQQKLTVVSDLKQEKVTVVSAPNQHNETVSIVDAQKQEKVTVVSAPNQKKETVVNALNQQQLTVVSAPNQHKETVVSAPKQEKVTFVSTPDQQNPMVVSAPNQQRLIVTSDPNEQERSVMCAPKQQTLTVESATTQQRLSVTSAPTQPKTTTLSAAYQQKLTVVSAPNHHKDAVVSGQKREKVTVISAPNQLKLAVVSARNHHKETVVNAPKQEKLTVVSAPNQQKLTVISAPKQQKLTVVSAPNQCGETVLSYPNQHLVTVVRAQKQEKVTVVSASNQQKLNIVRAPNQQKEIVIGAPRGHKILVESAPNNHVIASNMRMSIIDSNIREKVKAVATDDFTMRTDFNAAHTTRSSKDIHTTARKIVKPLIETTQTTQTSERNYLREPLCQNETKHQTHGETIGNENNVRVTAEPAWELEHLLTESVIEDNVFTKESYTEETAVNQLDHDRDSEENEDNRSVVEVKDEGNDVTVEISDADDEQCLPLVTDVRSLTEEHRLQTKDQRQQSMCRKQQTIDHKQQTVDHMQQTVEHVLTFTTKLKPVLQHSDALKVIPMKKIPTKLNIPAEAPFSQVGLSSLVRNTSVRNMSITSKEYLATRPPGNIAVLRVDRKCKEGMLAYDKMYLVITRNKIPFEDPAFFTMEPQQSCRHIVDLTEDRATQNSLDTSSTCNEEVWRRWRGGRGGRCGRGGRGGARPMPDELFGDNYCRKLSDHPLIYVEVWSVVASVSECRSLLRGGALVSCYNPRRGLVAPDRLRHMLHLVDPEKYPRMCCSPPLDSDSDSDDE